MASPRVALVTGASSGLGRAIARELARAGLAVFGTSRNPAAPPPEGVAMLPLDVRSDESVARCVAALVERAGTLDVLVNNAGVSLSGALEEATAAQSRDLLETNFLGATRTTRAALPLLRGKKDGHLVFVSSGLSRVRAPFTGLYAASKCALEGYAEALWHELGPLGIRVSVVLPGYCRTAIEESSRPGENRIDDYAPRRERALAVLHRRLERGMDPARVGRSVRRLVERRDTGLYHAIGADAVSVMVLRRLLPPAAFRALTRRLFRLEG